MAKLPEKFAKWHGIDREKIPWFPTIDEDKCIGCKLCFVSCGRDVFDFDLKSNKAKVARKYQCLVGCSTCATICPVEAISFSDRSLILQVEKEEKLLYKIRAKGVQKAVSKDLDKIKQQTMKQIEEAKTTTEYEIAGDIIKSGFFHQAFETIKDCDVDLLDIDVKVYSLKGNISADAPGTAKFKLVSTILEDVSSCEKNIESLIKANKIVIISKK